MSAKIVWPKIIFFGDSLTQRSFEPDNGFWACILANQLQRKGDVICRGFSGYNTGNCSKILPLLFHTSNFQNEEIRAFAIFLGANDCSLPTSTQHIALDSYQSNLKGMIKYLLLLGLEKEKIFLITAPAYDHTAYTLHFKAENGPDAVPQRSFESVKQYVTACVAVGQDMGIETLNLLDHFEKRPAWENLLIDGLHFSKEGSKLVAELIWPLIAKRMQGQEDIFPDWKDLAKGSSLL